MFILFALANFLCAAAVPLNRVLTDCGVEKNLTWTIILSRVIYGMLCNVRTRGAENGFCHSSALVSAWVCATSPCSEVNKK